MKALLPGAIFTTWARAPAAARRAIAEPPAPPPAPGSVFAASGLVDFKICAIDDTWSGLRFVRRAVR